MEYLIRNFGMRSMWLGEGLEGSSRLLAHFAMFSGEDLQYSEDKPPGQVINKLRVLPFRSHIDSIRLFLALSIFIIESVSED